MYRLKCEYSVTEAIGTIILWILISVITLGFGLLIMPYYLIKGPVNQTYLIDQNGNVIGRLHSEFNLGSVIGHAFIWFLLTIVTLGLALFIYYTSVVKRVLSAVEVR